MLTRQTQYVSAHVEKIIKEIQKEDSRFDFDLRSAHREKVVLPVVVKDMSSEGEFDCYSRNLSGTGICLLSQHEFEIDWQCILQISRLDESVSDIVAVSRWSKPFGPRHWISGWQFLSISKENQKDQKHQEDCPDDDCAISKSKMEELQAGLDKALFESGDSE